MSTDATTTCPLIDLYPEMELLLKRRQDKRDVELKAAISELAQKRMMDTETINVVRTELETVISNASILFGNSTCWRILCVVAIVFTFPFILRRAFVLRKAELTFSNMTLSFEERIVKTREILQSSCITRDLSCSPDFTNRSRNYLILNEIVHNFPNENLLAKLLEEEYLNSSFRQVITICLLRKLYLDGRDNIQLTLEARLKKFEEASKLYSSLTKQEGGDLPSLEIEELKDIMSPRYLHEDFTLGKLAVLEQLGEKVKVMKKPLSKGDLKLIELLNELYRECRSSLSTDFRLGKIKDIIETTTRAFFIYTQPSST